MDHLPPELCDRIVSFIVPNPRVGYIDPTARPRDDLPPRLSPLSTLSRGWQSAIERHVFRTLPITNDDLDDLDRIVTPRRRDYVRDLQLTVYFPDYDDELSKEYETNDERAGNNAITTNAVKRLFAVLGAWGANEHLELTLHLGFMSLGDKVREESGWVRDRGINEKRYEYSFVRLDGVEDFAKIPRVTMLQVHGTRPVELRSLYDLTSRLPRATRALWDTVEAAPFVRLRRELRDRFVLAVESSPCHIPPALQVTVETPEPYHGMPLPNLATPYAYDRVSSAFRQLSLRLTKFRFEGIADDTLLWPSPAQTQIVEPYWENLTSLNIELSLQSPLGKWYFLSEDGSVPSDVPIPDDVPGFLPPGYYDTGEESMEEEAMEYAESLQAPVDHDGLEDMSDHFRTRPNDENMTPLLAAFARAIGAMPSLRSAQLQFDNTGRQSLFYVAFAPPGGIAGDEDQLPEDEIPPATAPRLVAHTWDWRMDADLEGLFRRTGAGIHGVETAVRYLPDLYGF